MKYILEYKEYLSPIFHGTDIENLYSILKDNALLIDKNENGTEEGDIWFGRNKMLYGYTYSALLVFDRIKIKYNNSLLPFEWTDGLFMGSDESAEIIRRDLKNIDKKIISIFVIMNEIKNSARFPEYVNKLTLNSNIGIFFHAQLKILKLLNIKKHDELKVLYDNMMQEYYSIFNDKSINVTQKNIKMQILAEKFFNESISKKCYITFKNYMDSVQKLTPIKIEYIKDNTSKFLLKQRFSRNY